MIRYNISSQVRSVPCPGATLLLFKTDGTRYSLNRTGSSIWSDLSRGKTVEQIALQLVEEFDVTQDCALNDVCRVVEKLSALGLVSKIEDPQ